MTTGPPALEGGTDPAATAAFAAALAAMKREARAPVHRFHRWYGKLVPAIPAAAVATFTEPGGLVVDPFCGSGTTLVEALLAGRRAAGGDVSPFAALVARVKSRPIEPARLERRAAAFLGRAADPARPAWEERRPDLPNFDHYYPADVAQNLVRALDAAGDEDDPDVRDFLRVVVSAINRDVSNCDTRHVFPGVSARMRAAIADGWRADVPGRLRRALSDRVNWNAQAARRAGAGRGADVLVRDASEPWLEPADLVVTNPPYVSSIRYVETFKLEARWIGACRDRGELEELDRRTLGTERVGSRSPLTAAEREKLPDQPWGDVARRLDAKGEHLMARVVARYLAGLDAAMTAVAATLRAGGHAVVKLAPSRVRGETVPTPAACAAMLRRSGVELLGAVDDAYAAHSRTLTRARNWYSGRMDADTLLIFRKVCK